MNKLTYLLLPLLLQSTMPVLGAEDSPLANSSSSSRRGGLHLDDLENDTNDAQADRIAIILGDVYVPPEICPYSPYESILRVQRFQQTGSRSSHDRPNDAQYDAANLISDDVSTSDQRIEEPKGSSSTSARAKGKEPASSPIPEETQEWLLVSRILEPSANKTTVFKEVLKEQYDIALKDAKETLLRQRALDFSSVGVSTLLGAGALGGLIGAGFSMSTAIGGFASGSAVPCVLQIMLNKDKIKNAQAIQYFNKYTDFKKGLLEQTFNRYKNILNFFTEESVKDIAVTAMEQMAYYAHQPSEALLKQLCAKFRGISYNSGKDWQDVLQSIVAKYNNADVRETLKEWVVHCFMNGLLRKPYCNKFKARLGYSLSYPYQIVEILRKHNRYTALRMENSDLVDPFIVISNQSVLYKEPNYRKIQPKENFIVKLIKADKDKVFKLIGQPYFESEEINDSNREDMNKKILFMIDGFETEYDTRFLPDDLSESAELLSRHLAEIYKEQELEFEKIEF